MKREQLGTTLDRGSEGDTTRQWTGSASAAIKSFLAEFDFTGISVVGQVTLPAVPRWRY